MTRLSPKAEAKEAAEQTYLKIKAENKRMKEALESIAKGTGHYGAQALEYKNIAQTALNGEVK